MKTERLDWRAVIQGHHFLHLLCITWILWHKYAWPVNHVTDLYTQVLAGDVPDTELLSGKICVEDLQVQCMLRRLCRLLFPGLHNPQDEHEYFIESIAETF